VVRVDDALCADCGGCVGACHVNCITIAEPLAAEGARGAQGRVLTLGATCDECNVCVLLCPTGALTAEAPLRDWRRR
jgi:NAD-dependent dihydropyrimidine dehydrogenase PreA subunit